MVRGPWVLELHALPRGLQVRAGRRRGAFRHGERVRSRIQDRSCRRRIWLLRLDRRRPDAQKEARLEKAGYSLDNSDHPVTKSSLDHLFALAPEAESTVPEVFIIDADKRTST